MNVAMAKPQLIVAITTPLTPDLRPDAPALIERAQALLAAGCDGIALFGTTGEGACFSAADRQATLERLLAAGIAASNLFVAATTLSLAETAALAAHATQRAVAGVLAMPPCYYRGGIGEDGTVRFYEALIERIGWADLRLFLYHFPEISGIPVTPAVVRRLGERHGGVIAGVKDSGGDWDFTAGLLRAFPQLTVYTGTEIHVPRALASGGAGTICGLANVVPRLMRALMDGRDEAARQRAATLVNDADVILSRGPFVPSLKTVIADSLGQPAWRRVMPPLAEPATADGQRLIADFRAFEAALPAALREQDYSSS